MSDVKAKHSPTPWRLTENSWSTVSVYAADNQTVAELRDPAETEDDGIRETLMPDARLISAAPDLLEALQALTDPEGHIWHGNSGECTGECRDVRAALAKAGV